MFEIFGIPSQALFGQLLLGLINGSFYALLSLGPCRHLRHAQHHQFHPWRPIHDGRLRRLFSAAAMPDSNYWAALIVAPIVVGAFGMLIERTLLQWLYKLDHLYGLLLTFGLALIIEGVFRNYFGSSGLPYHVARAAAGRAESRLHVPAELPRLGGRVFARRLPRHLVRDRAHEARRLSARRDRKSRAGARLRHQCAAHDHADLRLRRGAGGARRRDGGADLQRSARRWALT